MPFIGAGVSALDLIDFESQSTFWHTPEDTLDKLSTKSLRISGDVILETIRLLNANGDRLAARASRVAR